MTYYDVYSCPVHGLFAVPRFVPAKPVRECQAPDEKIGVVCGRPSQWVSQITEN